MNARKRYRPLDSTEERSIHVGQKLCAIALEDETTYCMSWPEAPLTALLQRQPLKSKDTEAGKTLSGSILVPRVFTPDNTVDLGTDLREAFAIPSLAAGSAKPFIEISSAVGQKGIHPSAPPRPKSCSEDSVLTLTSSQRRDVRRSGVLEEIGRLLKEKGSISGLLSVEESAMAAVEHEIISLEWRAYDESMKTATALQRLLTLEAAIPFLPSADQKEDHWRRVVHGLWLRWRCTPKMGSALSTGPTDINLRSEQAIHPWGPALLCGALLSSLQQEYFLPQLVAANTSAAAASAAVSGWQPPMPRRRGTYNFLQWRVDRCLSTLPRTTPARYQEGADAEWSASGGAVLSSQEVDHLVETAVLPTGLLEVELDEDRGTAEKLLPLTEWSDLRQDLVLWKKWLSVVDEENL